MIYVDMITHLELDVVTWYGEVDGKVFDTTALYSLNHKLRIRGAVRVTQNVRLRSIPVKPWLQV